MGVVILLRASSNGRHNTHNGIGINNRIFLLKIPDVIVIDKDVNEIRHFTVGIDKVSLQRRIGSGQRLNYFLHRITGDLYL